MTQRRQFLKAISAAGTVVLAGCSGEDGETDASGDGSSDGSSDGSTPTDTPMGQTTTSGSSDGTQRFGISMKSMGQAGLYVQGLAGKWYTQDMDDVEVTVLDAQFDAAKQTQDAINLLNQGIDGLLLNPYDANASAQIVERATEENVPVMNFDTATLSKDIKLGALFGQYRGGEVAAERFTEMMDEKGMDSAKIITSVFNFSSTTSQQRLYGFTENVPDSVEVVSRIESNGTAEDSAPKTQNALQANPDVDAIYSNNVGSGMGALQALDQFGQYEKKGEDGHVMAFGIDGGPELNQRIGEGYYDFAIDQPLHMYAPLTLELMFDYLDGGDDALPQVGDTVTPGQELSLENKEVFGTNPWEEQFWGPADMVEYEAQDEAWWPWMKCRHAMITQDNADAPYLYGNVARAYEQQN